MSFPWTGKRAVVVDDSKAVREELSQLYSGLGLEIIGTAKDGVEAMAPEGPNRVARGASPWKHGPIYH